MLWGVVVHPPPCMRRPTPFPCVQLHIWLHTLRIHGLRGRGVGLLCVQARSHTHSAHTCLASPWISGPILLPMKCCFFFFPKMFNRKSIAASIDFVAPCAWFGSEGRRIQCSTWKEHFGCVCSPRWGTTGDSEPNRPNPERNPEPNPGRRGSSHLRNALGRDRGRRFGGSGRLRSDPH